MAAVADPVGQRIVAGIRPSEISVAQPTRFGLAINLKTAESFGSSVSNDGLISADSVID